MDLDEADRERGRRFVTRLYVVGLVVATAFGMIAVLVWPQGPDHPGWFSRFLVGWGSFGLFCLLASPAWYTWRVARENKRDQAATSK